MIKRDSLPVRFAIASLSGMTAVLFTHPIDQTKTILQLDGELARKGSPRAYQGIFDCIRKNLIESGIRGIYRGLTMSITREMGMNGFRIGMYEPVLKLLSPSPDPGLLLSFTASTICCLMASIAINPVEIIKVRLQTQGGNLGSMNRYKDYTGPIDGMTKLIKAEGIKGLFKGVTVSGFRLVIGGGAQLIPYEAIKKRLYERGWDKASPITHGICSLLSSVVCVAAVSPFDQIRTRLYNQPMDGETRRGLLYKNGLDAAFKVMNTEGIMGFYRGSFASLCRMAPHLTLIFVFHEQLKRMVINQ